MSISASQALKDYNVDLLRNLPLEDPLFYAMVEKAGLFSLDTGNSIQAKDTRAKKVSYFLGVIGPGADFYLPKLLQVMKDSGVGNVVQLAENIAAATGIGGESNTLTELPLKGNLVLAQVARLQVHVELTYLYNSSQKLQQVLAL